MSTTYSDPIGVKALLDAFYDKDGQEPDWAAVRSRIYTLDSPKQTLCELMKVMWAIYETDDDAAAQKTLLWSLLNKGESW